MNPKVQKVKEFVQKAYNTVSQKVKITSQEILKTEIAHKSLNAANPINHKLWIIYVTIQLMNKKPIDENIFTKDSSEMFDLVNGAINNDKKHKWLTAAILVATDYIIVKTMTKPVAKIVPGGIAKFTYATLSGGLTYVLNKVEDVNNSKGANLRERLVNALKNSKSNIRSLSLKSLFNQDNGQVAPGQKYLNEMLGADPQDSSDTIRVEIGKLLFASAVTTAFAEETSKRIAEQLQIKKFYFTLFNAAEVSYYVVKQRYSKNMKAVIIARLITVIFHGVLHLIHQTKYKNLAYVFHALFNIYSPILAVILSKKLK